MKRSHALRFCRSLVLLALVTAVLAPSLAHAELKHRYTFNMGNAEDSIGTAHATVIDAGAPTATLHDGLLDLSGNTGQASNMITNDAYLDLPNNIIENAALSGTSGAVSLEFWFTISTHRTWQRLGDFAGPLAMGGSEGVTNNGAVSYLQITPSSGRALNTGVEMTNQIGGGAESFFGNNTPLPTGAQQHVVAVYDKTDTTKGPGGSMYLYRNGVLLTNTTGGANGSIGEGFDLNNISDEDAWLGRSQWPDPVFDGSYNEFSVYDHALSPTEVLANFAAGPVPVPEPELLAMGVAALSVAIRRLRRRRR
jgi:hypothetical protein